MSVRMSPSISKLAAALVKAQSEMDPAPKRAKNAHLGNFYADLGAVIEAIVPVISKHGLSCLQFNTLEGLSTLIIHESGEYIEAVAKIERMGDDHLFEKYKLEFQAFLDGKISKLPQPANIPQIAKAAKTYSQRSDLCSAFLLATEDDDGNTASGLGINTPPQSNPQNFKKVIRSKEEVLAIHEAIKSHLVGWEITDRPAFQYDVSHYIETNPTPHSTVSINAFIAGNRNLRKVIGDKK